MQGFRGDAAVLYLLIRLLRYTFLMLAPYALRAEESRGRRYAEERHAYRNDFQRDRDRVVHSRAFRRTMWNTRCKRAARSASS